MKGTLIDCLRSIGVPSYNNYYKHKSMSIASHNKASYFAIKIDYMSLEYDNINTSENKEICESLDLVFDKCKVNNKIYKFKKESALVYLFSTTQRKRKGQVSKILANNLKIDIVKKVTVTALMKTEFNQYILKNNNESHISNAQSYDDGSEYSGDDIRFMNDRSVWYDWQVQIYNTLFHKSVTNQEDRIRKPHDREITFIYCPHGNTGKSVFWKWLQNRMKDSNSLGRLTIGSSQQLKSALVKMPHRQIYVCDIPRTISPEDQNRMSSLISTIESLKDGVLLNVMYGENTAILMDRPHIIISSNFLINPDLLSRDRLKILEITKEKTLINITEKTKKSFDNINKKQRKKQYTSVQNQT